MSKFRALGLAALIPISLGLGMQVLAQVLGALRAAVRHEPHAKAVSALLGQPFAIGLVQLIVSALVVLLVLEADRDRPWRELFPVEPVRLSTLGFAFAAGPPLQVVLSELENLVRTFAPTPEAVILAQRHLLENPAPLHRVGLFFALVIIAPLTEEALFRGAVQGKLHQGFPRAVAILLSALSFGLAHGPVIATIAYAFVGGLLLATILSQTRSLFTGMALHASINATPLLVPASLLQIKGVNALSTQVEHVSMPLLAGSLLSLIVCIVGIFVTNGPEEDR